MIIRNHPKRDYTVVTNRILQDTRLSPEAVGLLCYLASKPDNWKVRAAEIEARFKLGTRKRRRIMAELQTAEYLESRKGGPDAGYEVIVYIGGKPSEGDKKRLSQNATVAKRPPLVSTETAVSTETDSYIFTPPKVTKGESYPQGYQNGQSNQKPSAVERAEAATARVYARLEWDEKAERASHGPFLAEDDPGVRASLDQRLGRGKRD